MCLVPTGWGWLRLYRHGKSDAMTLERLTDDSPGMTASPLASLRAAPRSRLESRSFSPSNMRENAEASVMVSLNAIFRHLSIVGRTFMTHQGSLRKSSSSAAPSAT